MVQTHKIKARAQLAGDIVLTPGSVSETAFENDPAATLSVSGGGSWEYEILSDSSGGAFRIEGDRLVVADNARLDFETAPEVTVTIRATDSSGQSYTETMTIAVTDEAIERRYSTECEFMATETEAGWASNPIMVPLAGGGFALIWTLVADFATNNHEAVVRYFDADGTPASDEIVLLSGSFLSDVSATPLADGGFLLTRTVLDQATGTGGIEAQAYDDAGNAVGPAISIGGEGSFDDPAAVQLSTGGFAIAWVGSGDVIHAQRFDSAGTPAGPAIVVGADSALEPIGIVATPGGGFAVTWLQSVDGPDQVKAQFFDASGAPAGPPIAVAGGAFTTETPILVALADGSYVLGWVEFSGSAGGSVFQLKVLPIGADGLAGGPPVTLATYQSESHFGPPPGLVAHPDGGFVAMWPELEHIPNDRITYRFTGRQFDSSGTPIGPEFHPTQASDGADIAILADGTIATTWEIHDGDGQGVFARLFRPADERQATSGNDILYGDEGADWLDGLAGNDSLYGLGGDDELLGRSGNDSLSGGAGNDVLRGGGGNDFLDGGTGQDALRGRDGDDVYIVDDGGDTVVERADAGTDEVRTALASYALGAHLENLTGLSPAGQALTGNALANILTGGVGNDVLDGGAGADTMKGGLGNDVYFADAGDVVVEASGEGSDEVRTELASYTLGANLEKLTGGAAAQALTGNDLPNLIAGGLGADLLKGGGGNDTFLYRSAAEAAGDKVDGGSGSDTLALDGAMSGGIVFGNAALTAVERILLASAPAGYNSYNLSFGGNNIAAGKTLMIDGSALRAGEGLSVNAVNETQGSLIAFGGAGRDILIGGQQGDTLRGGLGNDYLKGNGGGDRFVYTRAADSTSKGFDQLVGFDHRVDKIDLPGSVSGWAPEVSHGRLAVASFDSDLAAALNAALGANQAILFRPDSGDLAGRLFAVIDANGDGTYRAGQDYVFEFVAPAVPLAPVTSFFV